MKMVRIPGGRRDSSNGTLCEINTIKDGKICNQIQQKPLQLYTRIQQKNLKSEGHSQFEKWKRYGYKEKRGGGSVNVVLIDSELDCGNSTAPYLLLHLKKKPLSH